MGWFPFSIFEKTIEKRVAHARSLMALGDYFEAHLELEGLDDPAAIAARSEAGRALVQLNLMEWLAQRGRGQGQDARDALDRARRFGASAEEIAAFEKAGLVEGYTAAHRLPRPK